MLRPELTIYDFLWIIQMAITIVVAYISYKEGEKKGQEKAKRRTTNRHYKLPNREIMPEDYFVDSAILKGGKIASKEMRRDIRKMKNRSR